MTIEVGQKDRVGVKVKEIFDKWEPLFQKSLQDCRWVVRGGHTMVYVASDDGMMCRFPLEGCHN
jgi:hypothetical protein